MNPHARRRGVKSSASVCSPFANPSQTKPAFQPLANATNYNNKTPQPFSPEEAIIVNWAWSLLLLGQQVTEMNWGSERSQIALKQPNQFVSDQQTHAWSPIVKKICNTNSKIKQRVQVNVQGGPEQRDQVSPSLRPDVHRRQLQLAAVSVVPTI